MANIIRFPEIDLTGIKAVFIDIDDTLYSYKKPHTIAIDICAEKALKDSSFKEKLDKDTFIKTYRNFRNIVTERLAPQGACRSRLIAFMEMFEELKINNSYNIALKYDRLYWNTLIKHIEAEEDAEKFLKKAKKSGCIVVAVSDMTTEMQIKKLKKLGFDKYIKYLVTSEAAGKEKPDSKIFQLALYKVNATPSEVIMIGDSKSKDIAGAENMGIKAYLVRDENV